MRHALYNEGVHKPGPKRHRDPEPWEAQVLGLISEHVAIPMDLLARFLKISRERAVRLMEEFASYRWVAVKQFLAADEPWVWLRKSGARHSTPRFKRLTPTLTSLPHRRAVCAIRIELEIEHPDGEWVCERALSLEKNTAHHIPDGVYEVCVDNGEREQWAIEAELSVKSIDQYREIACERRGQHDKVLYFCTPQVAALLRRTAEFSDSPNIVIRDFFKERKHVENFQWVLSSIAEQGKTCVDRSVQPWEKSILHLIADQYAVPVDHLARHLECTRDGAQRIADHLVAGGLLGQGRGRTDEAPWLWVTRKGARAAGIGFKHRVPSPMSTKRLRHANEARLYVTERDWDVRWWSRRNLLQGAVRGHVPTGIAESSDGQCAVEVEVKHGTQWLVKRYDQCCPEFEAILVFCTPRRVKSFERLAERHGWENLEIRSLDELNPEGRGRGQRDPVPYMPIPPEELPQKALQVVQEAEAREGPHPRSPLVVKSAAKARGSGAQRWRVATGSREWRVLHSPHGWFAQPSEELDETVSLLDPAAA